MPLALSVSCPGELGDSLPAIEQLKDRLWREEHCCIETVGWVHGFVVRLQEKSLERVKMLLAADGCTVQRITEQHYEWPEPAHSQQRPRQMEPWNVHDTTPRPPEVLVQTPEPIEPATVATPSQEPVIIPFPAAA